MIGSEVLFNSKCNLYDYMYNIIPKLFGKENITYSFRDTDSITYKLIKLSIRKIFKNIRRKSSFIQK